MNIDDTIKYLKEKAQESRKCAKECEEYSNRKLDKLMRLDKIHQKDAQYSLKHAEDCEQLAEWLLELKLLKEEMDRPIKTLGELATQFCCWTECKNCPVYIHSFEKRTEYEKTCLHEPCVSNLYKWIIEQVKSEGVIKELPINIKEEIEKYKKTLEFMDKIIP